jgi:hypothetical protein
VRSTNHSAPPDDRPWSTSTNRRMPERPWVDARALMHMHIDDRSGSCRTQKEE